MKKKYLPMYKRWLKRKYLPGHSGLCKALLMDAGLPTYYLNDEFFNGNNESFWFWIAAKKGEFNGVRQNIILLLAAKNGEL